MDHLICSDVNLKLIWLYVSDMIFFSDLLGWALKAMIVRHLGILWMASVSWELTERLFAHIQPGFLECWWDTVFIDVIASNGLGIWLGLKMCKLFKMQQFRWTSVRRQTAVNLEPDFLLCAHSRWGMNKFLWPSPPFKRFLYISFWLLIWQLGGLNSYFLITVFEIPKFHSLVVGRGILHFAVTAPSFRQYYLYITEPNQKHLGCQAWVFLAIVVSETYLCIIHGYDYDVFKHTKIINICNWILANLFLSYICVFGPDLWQRFLQYCNVRKWMNYQSTDFVKASSKKLFKTGSRECLIFQD
ncbi:phosphatidylserine synthase-like isoform X2 [Macrosteles quadrilineatus]|nr:phosphatidylserine synthase-like isoform X2 [Macrosteles quadrilineatus]